MPNLSSDANFIDRLNRGTESAAAELDRRYRARLCRLVERQLVPGLRSHEDPEDVVQTVFRTYFRRAAKGEFHIQNTTDLWALLAKITRHKTLKRAEYHRAEKRTSIAKNPGFTDSVTDNGPGPVDVAIVAELVELAIRDLEQFAADVFELRLAGCTEREIADQLECTRSKVRLNLRRIRERLATVGEERAER